MPDLHRGTTTAPASASASASQDPASWYMPGAGEAKKKKGFLSFLSKKDKKFKPVSRLGGLFIVMMIGILEEIAA